MISIFQTWQRLQTRDERQSLQSQWFWRLTPDRRLRAERAMHVEPALAGEHFVLGFTAQPDPISPQKRLSDGFAAMALR